MKTKIISISITEDLAKWLKQYSEFCEVSQSYLVREMIKNIKQSAEYGGYEPKL